MPVKPVKYVTDVISDYLAHIFNACIWTDIYPASIELATVMLTKKKGNHNNLQLPRDICSTCFFKGSEKKLILKRLRWFAYRFEMTHFLGRLRFPKHMSAEWAPLTQEEYML